MCVPFQFSIWQHAISWLLVNMPQGRGSKCWQSHRIPYNTIYYPLIAAFPLVYSGLFAEFWYTTICGDQAFNLKNGAISYKLIPQFSHDSNRTKQIQWHTFSIQSDVPTAELHVHLLHNLAAKGILMQVGILSPLIGFPFKTSSSALSKHPHVHILKTSHTVYTTHCTQGVNSLW